MTSRELKKLEEFANRGAPKAEAHLSEQEVELALEAIDQLERSLELSEDCQRQLKRLFDNEFPLPAAVIGAMNFSLLEMREQLPSLRAAARDAGR